MTTIYTPGFTWGSPLPSPEKKESFYLCELKWNAWDCAPTNKTSPMPERPPDVFCRKLIPVPQYVPSLLEGVYVRSKIKDIPIRVKNQKE